ncbi:MAG: aminotransferase class I/II-fold pyridoxal phosphate-dependent enzyme [Clostridia bacterium]|nr:aminotransferase class I/II-fold pyridoxal phosphate-dependent enzyme [Clostridia bacterium]
MSLNYDELLNPTARDMKPSGIRKFFDLAGSMQDVVTLSIGEPDFKTPWHIREAGISNLNEGKTAYTPNAGLVPLRRAITSYMSRRFGLQYDPDAEVIVTVGGSEGIDVTMRTVLRPGDEVLIPEPSFVCYAPLASMTGAVPVSLPTYEKDAFRLTPETLKAAITPKTKLLVLSYPNNPTGAIMTKADYEAIAAVLRDTQILVVSDEIYIELSYAKEPLVSFASIEGMRERTVVVNGFSKAYAMTGWRMGYVCGPKELIRPALKLHQFGIMSAPTTSQYAAVEALEHGAEDIAMMREKYNMRRKFLLRTFERLNIPCFEPLGAFYVFPNLSRFGLSSEEFCRRFLEEEKVAMVPGNAFGESGEGFARISYAYSMDHLKIAMDRLERFISRLEGEK